MFINSIWKIKDFKFKKNNKLQNWNLLFKENTNTRFDKNLLDKHIDKRHFKFI